MLAGSAVRAKAEKRAGAIGQTWSDIPTGTPCLVCCVVEPLPTILLSVRRLNVEITLALVAVEHKHHVGVTTVRLVNVELLFGHL